MHFSATELERLRLLDRDRDRSTKKILATFKLDENRGVLRQIKGVNEKIILGMSIPGYAARFPGNVDELIDALSMCPVTQRAFETGALKQELDDRIQKQRQLNNYFDVGVKTYTLEKASIDELIRLWKSSAFSALNKTNTWLEELDDIEKKTLKKKDLIDACKK